MAPRVLERRGRDPERRVGAGAAQHGLEPGRPVRGARRLVTVRRVRDPAGGQPPDVANGRIEVDAVGHLRQVLALHRERRHPVADRRLE